VVDYANVAIVFCRRNNAYNIFGYSQVKINLCWTSKQVVDHLGSPVRRYGANDVIFGVVEKSLKPSVIILKLKALSEYGFVTESGLVRCKGKKSPKRTGEVEEAGEDDDEEDDGEEDDEEDDELNKCNLFIKDHLLELSRRPNFGIRE